MSFNKEICEEVLSALANYQRILQEAEEKLNADELEALYSKLNNKLQLVVDETQNQGEAA